MYLLGYDIGSSSVKASLVDAQSGLCVASDFFPKQEMEIIAVKSGWAEQNPEQWWENLKLATESVLKQSNIDASDFISNARSCRRRQESKSIASGNHLVRQSCSTLWRKSI